MKVVRILSAVGALALAATALNASLATAAAPAASYDISFDGYCDGLHLNIPSVGLPGTAQSVDGDQTGCLTGGVFGQARANPTTGRYGVTKGSEFVTIPGFSTFTVVKRDHTWVHYGQNGNLIYVLNSGTWSLGPPAARPRPGMVSSLAGADARAAAPHSVTTVKEISFDGYCDGMHLVSPSAGLATAGTLDGYRTGCATEGLIGAKTRLGQSTTPTRVAQFNTAGVWIQTSILSDHTWVHYSISGDTIYVLNSGTWSAGPPALRAGGSSTG